MIQYNTIEAHARGIDEMTAALDEAARPDPRLEALAMELESLANNDNNTEARRAFRISARRIRELAQD